MEEAGVRDTHLSPRFTKTSQEKKQAQRSTPLQDLHEGLIGESTDASSGAGG